jgi:hypothetical protein
MRTPTRWTWLPNHVSDSTTQVVQDHATTGVLLVRGTNNHLHELKNAIEQQLEHYWPTPAGTVSTTSQTGPYWKNMRTSTEGPYTSQAGVAHRSDPSKLGNPKSTKQTYWSPNRPKLETAATRDNNELTQTFTRGKTHWASTLVRPVSSTSQIGQAGPLRDEQLPRVNSPKSNSWPPESLHGSVQDFGDSRNTSWALHSQDLVHQNFLNRDKSKKSHQECL